MAQSAPPDPGVGPKQEALARETHRFAHSWLWIAAYLSARQLRCNNHFAARRVNMHSVFQASGGRGTCIRLAPPHLKQAGRDEFGRGALLNRSLPGAGSGCPDSPLTVPVPLARSRSTNSSGTLTPTDSAGNSLRARGPSRSAGSRALLSCGISLLRRCRPARNARCIAVESRPPWPRLHPRFRS